MAMSLVLGMAVVGLVEYGVTHARAERFFHWRRMVWRSHVPTRPASPSLTGAIGEGQPPRERSHPNA